MLPINHLATQEAGLKWENYKMFCAEKRRLQADFMRYVQEMLHLCADQSRAVIDGDPDFSRFDLLLHSANEKKDHAKYALMAHIDAHQCGEEMFDDVEQSRPRESQ